MLHDEIPTSGVKHHYSGIWSVDEIRESGAFSNGDDLLRTLLRTKGRQRGWQGEALSGVKSTIEHGVASDQIATLPRTSLKILPSCVPLLKMQTLVSTFKHR